MKNKMNIKRRILSLCLACLMLFELVAGSELALAAAPITWANTQTATLNNNSYYKITDMTTYGKNYTGTGNFGLTYDVFYEATDFRVTYFKKIPASYGQQLRFITAEGDIASGYANTVASKSLYYSLNEYDANGNVIFDGGWQPLSSVWTAGQTVNTGVNIGDRTKVAYIVFLFKWADGMSEIGTGAASIAAQQIVNETKNLYIAKGSLNYTLSYNANGGSVTPTSKTITYGSTYGSLPTPTRTGYTFNGWYTAASGGSKISSSTAMNKAADQTLYARWTANNYTVYYNANGGSGTTSASSHTYGTAKTLTANGFKRTGYTFNGWNTKTDGTGTRYTNQQSVSNLTATNGGSITLYAQWTHNVYTVTYDSNGGSTANITKNYYYADNVDLSPVAEKTGKIFVGWNTDPNATKAMESFTMPDCATSSNANYKNDWEVTLYAVYTIPVSDVANHTYPAYEQVKEEEVYFRVWEIDSQGNANEDNIRVYPLTFTRDIITMKYRYVLPTTDISDFVSGMADYGFEILAYDNAGNYTTIYKSDPPPPQPVKYIQTVIHYIYDQDLNGWASFLETTEKVLEGVIFTPEYTTPPAGYRQSHIDGEYIVDGPKTSSAYYVPIDYTLTFDPNGGTCDVTEKTITFNDYYGTMPTPYKEGYEFLGWFTEAEGGTQVLSSHKYLTPDNTTVYAHWKVRPYIVTYDYWTNGGKTADKMLDTVDYGNPVDLSVIAYKDGWEFVGWNTDSTATIGLTSMTTPAKDMILYAIYKKDITLIIMEQTDNGQVIRSETKTIYNTQKEATFPMTEVNTWTGWNFLGWTNGILAMDYPVVGIGNEYKLSESDTLYGLYTSTITLSYDTNGSSMVIEEQKKDGYYNASGDTVYPEFILASAPVLSQHSFVEWNVESGTVFDETGQALTTCNPGEKVIISSDTVLKTIWNKHPEIEAYDRYFTLEQAQNGDITQAELLKKVTATDLEDGTLVNGVDVIVIGYNAEDFTSLEADAEIEITYQATDSFGNVVTRTITANVTDTTVRKSNKRRYVRFISPEFFKDEDGNLLPASEGGLEETSVWRTDNKRSILEKVLEEIKKKS